MSCEGCFQSGKGLKEEYERIKCEAANYAKQNKTTTAIWKEGFEYRYGEAATNTDKPIIEIISY